MVKRKKYEFTDRQLVKLIGEKPVNILRILGKEKNLNLSQLQRKMRVSSIEARRHTDKLIKAGVVLKTKKIHERGSPLTLTLQKKSKKKRRRSLS